VTDRLLTADEVAELLTVPVSWVRESTLSGAMPCVRLGRYVRFDRAAVESWLQECRQPDRRSCCGGPRVWLNSSRAPVGVPCCGLALHFGFGLSPQPTDARRARGEELQGERTLLRGQIDARRGKTGCVGPVRSHSARRGDTSTP